MMAALGLVFLIPSPASASYTVTPSTWNIIGLDSNTPAFGPNHFPVGVKVCSTTVATNVDVTFTWDSANSYVALRPGSSNPVTIPSIAAGGCADAYFEVEVTKDSAAFDTSRRYHITAGGASTTTPREIYVERLVSQSRNYITNVKLDGTSIPAGGSMNLMVGNTYTIELYGGTATQGYNQFEEFINFPNTIFQVLSVSTTYSANDSPFVSNPNDGLYADACQWENDPNSPFYRSCWFDYKAGGNNVVTTYTVKIISGGGSTETLGSLLYDFSGSSYHYNADYSTGARFANIIDPTNLTISKSFTPDPTNVNGVSTLTFTLTNPNAGAVSGVNFTDTFPTSPGAMKAATPPNASTSGCGTPTFAPAADAASISFSNGTIAANSSCTVKVDVTTTATGTYTNISDELKVDTLSTGKTATDTLVVNDAPPPTPPVCGLVLAQWTMPTAGQGSGGPPPPYTTKASDVTTATASYTGGTNAISATIGNLINSWSGTGFSKTTVPGSGTAPYYELAVDSSKYTNVTITLDTYASANWVTSNVLYVWSSADGGAFAATSPATGALVKTTWSANQSFAAATTGATTTTNFRINAMGANTTGSDMYLDNIVVTGCGIPNPPTMTKSFSPNPVAVGATSSLTFTVTNPNAGVSLSGVAFTDILPAGLTVANSTTSQCGGTNNVVTNAATRTIAMTGGTIAAGGSCTITATVTAATAGPHTNVSGFVTSTTTGTNNAGSSGIASASLTAVSPPSISKLFAPNPILAGGVSTLTLTITNPNQNNGLSGVAFSDTFPVAPGAMKVATPATYSTSGCGAPTFTPVAGAASISFSSGTIAAAGTCTVTVDVTAPSTGTYNNTSGNVSHVINAATVNGNTASGSLTASAANPHIALLKQVGPGATGPWSSYMTVATGADVYYKFTIENTGDVPLNPVSVSDPTLAGTAADPAGCSWTNPLPVASPSQDPTETCVRGPIAAVSGSHLNTATASGTYSGTPYTDTSSATYATTGLSITKSATQTYFTATGNILNYSYVVMNSGYATLSGPVTVADDKSTDETCPALSTIGDFDNYFDPSEAITCTATYTVAAADVTAKLVTNTAYATVGGVNSSNSTKTVPLAADLSATKTNNVSGTVGLNSQFTWTLTVRNSAASGSSASFLDTQTLLTDDLPDSGATYAVGTVKKTGATGTINCSIATNTLTCTASGGTVTIPPGLQGTVSVTNGSAAVTGAGTAAFTTQLTAGSIILISGVPYTVSSISSDTALTLTTNYSGATASGLAVPGSFSVPITVTSTAYGSLANPKGGGVCKADPLTVIAEIDETNNTCADTVTVQDLPSITVVKTVTAYSDPINGTTSPKAIPGSFMTYTVMATNTGPGAADNNTTVITDPIPATTELFVGDINGAGSGPVLFTDGASCSPGTAASGLSFSFINLSNTGDNISFSKSNGTTYDAVSDIPTADANQCDSAVTNLKVSLGGPFNGTVASGGSNTSFCLQFRVRVK